MNKPEFITFTGADQHTSIAGMQELSAQYPIEWAILFSPGRQGSPSQTRYPPLEYVRELVKADLIFAAHLCGEDAKQVMNSTCSQHDDLLAAAFHRVQINTAKTVNTSLIAGWGRSLDVSVVLQSRDAVTFPTDSSVEWLFDASGGHGVYPNAWPAAPLSQVRYGYAGGLNPENVTAAIGLIGARSAQYYIDMETGVRDSNDRFDLERCRKVCEAVFATPALNRTHHRRPHA